MKGLTQRQTQILDFIDQYVTDHGYSPTYHEIMHQFEFSSPGTVYRHLQTLKRKGRLVSEPHCARSILPAQRSRPSMEVSSTRHVPVIGRLRAGSPLETYAAMKDVEVPASIGGDLEGVYALDVVASGFQDELLADGDLLFVATGQEPQEGDTVVVVIPQEEAVVRRYFLVEDYLRLESRNLSQQPIIVRASDTRPYGVVIGVIRRYTD